jgi:hypothetical protein
MSICMYIHNFFVHYFLSNSSNVTRSLKFQWPLTPAGFEPTISCSCGGCNDLRSEATNLKQSWIYQKIIQTIESPNESFRETKKILVEKSTTQDMASFFTYMWSGILCLGPSGRWGQLLFPEFGRRQWQSGLPDGLFSYQTPNFCYI